MLYLASASPRRRELLAMLGLNFTVCPADCDEAMDPARSPEEEVGRVSALKAAAAQAPEDAIVIAADTIVVCEDEVMGKPKDVADARRMLLKLMGNSHRVLTGVTVKQGEKSLTHVESTSLHFREATEAELEAYLASGESLDKAGAYGIQGKAGIFCEAMTGDYYNVMGLPLCALSKMLAQFGVSAIGGGSAT